jgi:ketosteroid isomerase-like protein
MITREVAMRSIHTAVAVAFLFVTLSAQAQQPVSWTEPVYVPSRADAALVERQHLDQEAVEAVGEILDRFHQAAAEADADTYFSLLEDEAVYLGTDAGERWSVDEFRAFAKPYFDRGQGWTYVPTSRHVDLDDDRSTAWFDDMLENDSYGTTRGTGVLTKTPDGWRIVQYHLTIPIPNEIAKEVVERIRKVGTNGG